VRTLGIYGTLCSIAYLEVSECSLFITAIVIKVAATYLQLQKVGGGSPIPSKK